MNKTLIGGIVAAGFALAVVSGGAFAQAFPAEGKPIRIIVPTAPSAAVRAQLGAFTEVLQNCDMLHDLFKMIADVAVDWDGKDPIRYL